MHKSAFENMRKTVFKICVWQLLLIVLFSNTFLANAKATTQLLEINYLQPASYLIEDIHIVGTRELEPEALLATLDIQVGDIVQIPGPSIESIIRKIWQQKLVKDVQIYATTVTAKSIILTIEIAESKRLAQYSFEGLKKSEIKELEEFVTLEKGKIVTSNILENIQKNICAKLVQQGYLNAQVDVITFSEPDSPAYLQVKIKVHKGDKVIINKIFIHGNKHIHEDELKAQLRYIHEKPRFTLVKALMQKLLRLEIFQNRWGVKQQPSLEDAVRYFKKHVIPFPAKLVEADYEKDKQNLIAYYHSQGYRDARIVADSVSVQSQGLLNISLQIEEGKQYRFGNITWLGNTVYDEAVLNKILGIKSGDIYNLTLLAERLFNHLGGNDIASLYMNNGYLFFYAEPVEVNINDHLVDIEIRMQEGAQATIKQVNIRGNNHTYEHVIRRELKTLPGEKFNKAKLQRSQRDLTLLNIFDPAINIIPTPNPVDSTVDLDYIVEEKPKFDIKFASGWAGGRKFHASLTLGGNNFSLRKLLGWQLPLGEGQHINLKADFHGKNYQDFSFQFMEPWLGGKKPINFSVAINKAFEQYAKYLETDKPGYLGSLGVKVALGARLTWPDDFFVVRCGLGYIKYDYKDYPFLQEEDRRQGVTYDITFQTTLARNSLNDAVYPRLGSEIGLHLKFTPPYSLFSSQKSYHLESPKKTYKWKEYHQWLLDMSYFYNPLGDWVINVRAHGGIVGGYSAKQGVGPFGRFSMGGHGMVLDVSPLNKEGIGLRGYKDGYILPYDQQKDYKGGTIFDKFVVELRHPIAQLPVMYIYALAFAEAGNTWLHYANWGLFDLKKSVGLGLRIHSIVGTLGFDWGYGFDQAGEDKLELHYSFGMKAR
jgi:outer membrane protein insertion porin family